MSEHEPSISDLNDALRSQGEWGQIYITQGVKGLREEVKAQVIQRVRIFDDFTEDNDPNEEHDFWSVEVNGEKFFWKIDYYSKDNPSSGSEDPANPDVTKRVMTIMRASEY